MTCINRRNHITAIQHSVSKMELSKNVRSLEYEKGASIIGCGFVGDEAGALLLKSSQRPHHSYKALGFEDSLQAQLTPSCGLCHVCCHQSRAGYIVTSTSPSSLSTGSSSLAAQLLLFPQHRNIPGMTGVLALHVFTEKLRFAQWLQ